MSESNIHQNLIHASQRGNIDDVVKLLNARADPNYNIRMPLNALSVAIQKDNHEIIKLLLEHGATLNESILQKALEQSREYLEILIPNFSQNRDKSLLLIVLQVAINIDDFELAKQAISQGAQAQSLYIYDIQNLRDTNILELLLENGFNIHAEKNMILSEWMGSSLVSGGESWKSTKVELLTSVFEYYFDKPNAIEKFDTLRVSDKKRLFLIGLYSNHLSMMKFAIMIGADKNEALNSAHRQYKAYKDGDIGSIYSTVYKNNRDGAVDYEIIKYILNSGMAFNASTIARAVCFDHDDIINAIRDKEDLEYAYEMAYSYEKEELCQYFIDKGVSKEARNISNMRVSAIKGDLKKLREAHNAGADISALKESDIVQIINKNQVKTLAFLCESGLAIDERWNNYLNEAMSLHKAYATVTFLIENGLDIGSVRIIPSEYKNKYPIVAAMHQKRFKNIFDYTLYLATELYPTLDGVQKEQVLERISELSALPYVQKRSQERLNEEQ